MLVFHQCGKPGCGMGTYALATVPTDSTARVTSNPACGLDNGNVLSASGQICASETATPAATMAENSRDCRHVSVAGDPRDGSTDSSTANVPIATAITKPNTCVLANSARTTASRIGRRSLVEYQTQAIKASRMPSAYERLFNVY